MKPFAKDASEISFSDIQSLVSARAQEDRTTEFKLELPGDSDSEKAEFLADVSALANSAGGAILYGLREDDGVAAEIVGVDSKDTDATILRLDNILSTGLSPRVPGIRILPVKSPSQTSVIIVAVPRSWQAPHMVSFRGTTRFYARASNGRYPMDVDQIREAFLASEGIANRIRQHHANRCSEIRSGRSLIPTPRTGLLVAHLLPVSSLQSPQHIDISFLERDYSRLLPIDGGISAARYNLDGFATAAHDQSDAVFAYSQLSRSGIFETATVALFRHNRVPSGIPADPFEGELARFLANGLTIYRGAGIDPPYVALLSLFNVRSYIILPNKERFPTRSLEHAYNRGIDRDDIALPELILTETDTASLGQVARPWFDSLWNAAGWPGSLNFDETGSWTLSKIWLAA